jgi:6-phosphofructokinase 1
VGRRFTIVVVAEGVKLPPELKENRRASPVGNLIGNAIATGANKEVRISVLGHIQRGGSPSPFDRILATRFGVAAVDLIAAGGFGMMVALRGESISQWMWLTSSAISSPSIRKVRWCGLRGRLELDLETEEGDC